MKKYTQEQIIDFIDSKIKNTLNELAVYFERDFGKKKVPELLKSLKKEIGYYIKFSAEWNYDKDAHTIDGASLMGWQKVNLGTKFYERDDLLCDYWCWRENKAELLDEKVDVKQKKALLKDITLRIKREEDEIQKKKKNINATNGIMKKYTQDQIMNFIDKKIKNSRNAFLEAAKKDFGEKYARKAVRMHLIIIDLHIKDRDKDCSLVAADSKGQFGQFFYNDDLLDDYWVYNAYKRDLLDEDINIRAKKKILKNIYREMAKEEKLEKEM